MTTLSPYELWLDFKAWVNTQQGGFMPPQSIFIRVANLASTKLWEKWVRDAEKSQEIRDNLLPFLVSKNVKTVRSNSYYNTATPPPDYGRYASCKILVAKENVTVPAQDVDKGKCYNANGKLTKFESDQDLAENYYENVSEREVTLVDNQRWSAALQHLTKKPTFDNPKITQINHCFKVAPKEVGVIVLNYYIEPVDAVFGYTAVPGNLQTGSGGAIVYDPKKSKDFQWDNTVKNDLLEMIKEVYIGFTRDGLYQQINAQQKSQP